MPTEDYLQLVVRELESLKKLADGAIAQLTVDQIFQIPGPGDNSVAVIMKHVSGNMKSRWKNFLTSDGEKPDRMRDREFVMSAEDTCDAVFARWCEGWAILFGELAILGPDDLGRMLAIRGESLTVLQAINRQLTHYAYHVGQIVYLAKHLAGRQWKSLSIPLGGSEQFNRSRANYIKAETRPATGG